MPDPVSLEQQLTELFQARLNLAVPSIDTDLFESAGLDSLMLVELLLHLEREFGLKVSLEDLELDNFRSIERLAKFVADHTGRPRNGEEAPLTLAGQRRSSERG